MSKIEFGIYIAGPANRYLPVINAFKEVCSKQLEENSYRITIVDITKDPFKAEAKKILAAPTITRENPFPEKRIIGDIRQPEKALRALHFLVDDLKTIMLS